MDAYYATGRLIVFIAVAAQCLFVLIQGRALIRYRQHCFTLLFCGAFVGVVYAVLAGLPLFMSFDLPTRVLLLKISVILATIGSSLGIWGMLSLLRSYQVLAQRARLDGNGIT